MPLTLFAADALTPDGWRRDVRIDVDGRVGERLDLEPAIRIGDAGHDDVRATDRNPHDDVRGWERGIRRRRRQRDRELESPKMKPDDAVVGATFGVDCRRGNRERPAGPRMTGHVLIHGCRIGRAHDAVRDREEAIEVLA